MPRLAGWLGLVVLALVLASCGQPQNVKSDVAPAQGTLEIAVQGVAQAPVQVFSASDPSSPVYAESVAGTADVALGAGTYRIDGAPVSGSEDPSPTDVVVKAGQTTRVVLAYQQVSAPSAPATALTITHVTDGTGAALPSQAEQNINKDVLIYASQTEEAMCVTVSAKDASGQPVSDAPVVVNVSDGLGWLTEDRIAILRGCAGQGGTAAQGLTPASFRDNIYTGADGTATFTLYATSGISAVVSGLTTSTVGNFPGSDIAKIVVAVENDDNTSVLQEFKAVFYNIAHLWAQFESNDPVPTGQRVGKSFPMITNLWNEKDLTQNRFWFDTVLYQKQPEQRLPFSALGQMRYTIVTELDKNGAPADVVHFEGCDAVKENGTVCYDTSGGASIVPNDGLHLEDMPIKVQVQATLLVYYTYGSNEYVFALKGYDFSKQWIGSYLRITKSVDHHVLTWAGEPNDEKTLDAANAVAENSPFTATFTLTATNEGTDDVYDISIADLLPAELGIVESSIQPGGGTYDSAKHAVTWNFQQNQAVAGFKQLGPGESVSVTFQVYVRQKPGYCVDYGDLQSSFAYASHWAFQLSPDLLDKYKVGRQRTPCYDDPYEIVNGYALHDVTASWFSSAPSDQGGIEAVTDFNGWVNADAVVIWAVRPEFSITKVLANPQDSPFLQGEDGLFDITVENMDVLGIDRQDVLAKSVSYADLMNAYPSEFNGSPRDNPYGSNVSVGDAFSLNLDFNDATPLTLHDDDMVNPDQSFAAQFPTNLPWILGDKTIGWQTMPLMGGGDYAQTRVTLDHDGASWWNMNMAGVIADNLNQFHIGSCFQGDLASLDAIVLHPIRTINLITDAACTVSIEPTTPWFELDSVGTGYEYILGGITRTFHSNVLRGEDYAYVFTLLNSGSADAPLTTNVVTIDDTTAATITGGYLVVFNDVGTLVSSTFVAADSAGQITFGPYTHPAGWTADFVIEAHANQVANVTATATVNYDADSTDAQYPLLPLTMSEIVSIQPPF